jgi:hypothetical protein
MGVELLPLRWPASWKNPVALNLLDGTPINCLVGQKGAIPEPLASQARQKGLTVVDQAAPPVGVFVAEGVWPGVQATQGDTASSGPTGNPWVDSNGWKVRLESVRHPGARVWVDARPKGSISPDSYPLVFADCAVYGGRWIVSLDDQFAAAVAQGNANATASWKKLTAAAKFFDDRKAWSAYTAEAVVGIISDFDGDNEFMGGELLNLVARTNQQYRVLLKSKLFKEQAFAGIVRQPQGRDLCRRHASRSGGRQRDHGIRAGWGIAHHPPQVGSCARIPGGYAG